MKRQRLNGLLFLYAGVIFIIQPLFNDTFNAGFGLFWMIASGLIFSIVGAKILRSPSESDTTVGSAEITLAMVLLCTITTIITIWILIQS